MYTRRAFLGGALSFAGCAQLGVGSDSEPPLLRIGVLSDLHVRLSKGGAGLSKGHDTNTFVRALRRFRDSDVDAVVVAGDMADSGMNGELEAVAKAWYGVFPEDRGRDGHKVERIFVFGNHDWNGMRRGARVYEDAERRRNEAICTNPAGVWRRLFNEEYAPVYRKKVRGFDFIGAHWCAGDCNGKAEKCHSGLLDFYREARKTLPADRPFFHVQHPHPRGTVHGPEVWGQDDGECAKALSNLSNAIVFSGHSHTSLVDGKSVWQGAFTSVGCGSLRYIDSPGGRLYECRQGQLVTVYEDRIVLSRREFEADVPLGDDLVVRLPPRTSGFIGSGGRTENEWSRMT